MIKIIFLSFIFVFLSFFLLAKTDKNLIIEDLEYFKNIIENCYIAYDDISSNQNAEIDIDFLYEQYKKNAKKKKKNASFEKGINQDALLIPLWEYLNGLNLDDGHLRIDTNTDKWTISKKNKIYSSDYFFRKEDSNYILSYPQNSDYLGKIYLSSLENLKPTIHNNTELFKIALLTKTSVDKIFIQLDQENLECPLKWYEFEYNNSPLIKLIKTDECLYLRIADFYVNPKSESYNFYNKTIDDFSKEIIDKNYIILDLIGNPGGYQNWCYEILGAMNEKKDNNTIQELNDFITLELSREEELHSLELAKNSYLSAIKENLPQDVINIRKKEYDTQVLNPKRYISNISFSKNSGMPRFDKSNLNKKIIVLIDSYTASAAELLISLIYTLNLGETILVGENSRGSAEYGKILDYILPNSKLKIKLASSTRKNAPLLALNEKWHGENYGFYPDYWITYKDIIETLVYLTKDVSLREIDF